MSVDLLIFDWDGTLMDSQAKIVSAMGAAFNSLGFVAPDELDIRNIIGLSLDEAILRLDSTLPREDRLRLAEAYRQGFNETTITASLFPNTIATLDRCLAQGFELAIATGKSHAGLQSALEETELLNYFKSVRTADRCESKPSPAMIEELLWENDVVPDRALMIGDTSFDLQMARNAGVRAIAACYGAHSRAELAEHEPLFFIERIDELPDKLGKIAHKF